MSRRDLRRPMTRAEATALLAVAPGADREQVRRAWRTWARLAHPDRGGDREFFDRLRIARDVLLCDGAHPLAGISTAPPTEPDAPPVRLAWAQVLRQPHPAEIVLLGLLVVVAVALAAFVATVGANPPPVALALAAGPAAVAAAGVAAVVVTRTLTDRADVAHRITALTVAWVPIVVSQAVLAEVVGVSLIPVLPVLVLPFVLVVAAVNPGAGLWSHARFR